MPGKVNPVLPEAEYGSPPAIGNDTAVNFGSGGNGHFELNVCHIPMMAQCLSRSPC